MKKQLLVYLLLGIAQAHGAAEKEAQSTILHAYFPDPLVKIIFGYLQVKVERKQKRDSQPDGTIRALTFVGTDETMYQLVDKDEADIQRGNSSRVALFVTTQANLKLCDAVWSSEYQVARNKILNGTKAKAVRENKQPQTTLDEYHLIICKSLIKIEKQEIERLERLASEFSSDEIRRGKALVFPGPEKTSLRFGTNIAIIENYEW